MVLKELEKKYPKRKINYKEYDDSILYDQYGFNSQGLKKDGYDMYGFKKKSSKIKISKAKSFKDQKGKGCVGLPILLSKMYTNNNSKELKTNIRNLLNHLYDDKQITKQVYNILNQSITYKNDS